MFDDWNFFWKHLLWIVEPSFVISSVAVGPFFPATSRCLFIQGVAGVVGPPDPSLVIELVPHAEGLTEGMTGLVGVSEGRGESLSPDVPFVFGGSICLDSIWFVHGGELSSFPGFLGDS